MDACLNIENAAVEGKRALARIFVRCVCPIERTSSAENALTLLNCVKILRPSADIRRLQGLMHFSLGQFVEAMQILAGMEDMSAKALVVLCQRAVGESSWWGEAQAIYESGDVAAIELLRPWMKQNFSHENEPLDPSGATEPGGHADSSLEYPFVPLRA